MLLREMEPERYWSMPPSYTKEKRTFEINSMIQSGRYYWQLKTDGNYSAFICDFDRDKRIISRGVSTVTKEYGCIQDRLFFWEDVMKAFDKPTRIMAEVYLDKGIDRNVGSILRSLPLKAKSIQDEDFYERARKVTKFSAKDRRDIENNEFRNVKLKWRIFDVWYYDGEDLMKTPWIERQKYVKAAAERINNPLVTYVHSYPMDETFYDKLNMIFANGGEGVVCYDSQGLPEPGKRTAHKTMKVKRELENSIDCFITGIEPAVETYTGKDVQNWNFWKNIKTGEKVCGLYFSKYQNGESYAPISKGFYYGWPGAIYTAVYDSNGNIIPLCKVAGLTEDFKEELKNNFSDWYMCPVTIGGMALSEADGLSVRHPYLISIRKGDIDPKDCTFEKIFD